LALGTILKKVTSSTQGIPETSSIPHHLAMIMDGNGRWAKMRHLPRVAGHKKGLESIRSVVKAASQLGIEYLTLFAFSSENWRRPKDEVSFLMNLFIEALNKEVGKLNQNNVRLRIIGNRDDFSEQLNQAILAAETLTENNTGLNLTFAVNYGGRWDIMQAINAISLKQSNLTSDFSEEDLSSHLSMSFAPEPDLFIRTGGEKRISNFLLWQLAYTEFYFTDTLWPDFDEQSLHEAIFSYQQRERRFGRTSEQIETIKHA
jgi:undecaprenyl diphosphate synthase